jgi:hypothetical protein
MRSPLSWPDRFGWKRTPDERSPEGRTKDFGKVGPDADRGYIDKHFTGWVDPAKIKLLDYATLAELLIAYVDDAQAAGDTRAFSGSPSDG